MEKRFFLSLVLLLIITTLCFCQEMIKIPGTRYKMLKTEVTQELYESVMGENPSFFKTGSERYKYKNGDDFIMLNGEDEKKLPVEQVSWYDAIYFCNKLSEMQGLTPVYSVKGSTDVTKWGYTPHKGNAIDEHVKWNKSANGYRLPTWDEHDYAANGGQNHTYPGSNDIYEVCWYAENSADRTHSVAQKKPNAYGLYDMSGNVCEWCWNTRRSRFDRYHVGGSICSPSGKSSLCEVGWARFTNASKSYYDVGFRVVCAAD